MGRAGTLLDFPRHLQGLSDPDTLYMSHVRFLNP